MTQVKSTGFLRHSVHGKCTTTQRLRGFSLKTDSANDLRSSVTDLPPLSGVLSELIRVCNSKGQLSQYVAVMCGIRRAIDDWIPIDCLDAFKSFCSGLGLHVAPDIVFEPVADPEKYPSLSLSPT